MKASPLDQVIAWAFPGWAIRRAAARWHLERLYDAAQVSPRRRQPTDQRSGDAVVDQASWKLRAWARHLEQNVDLIAGLLEVLATQASAITIEPQVRRRSGELHEEANRALADLWEEHREGLDVAGELGWSDLVFLVALSWLRDGEVLVDHLERADLPGGYRTRLPYQVRILEADYLPFDLVDASKRIVHGVEKDAAGRAVRYHLYPEHPGSTLHTTAIVRLGDLVAIDAERISHLKRVRRAGQTRGVTCLAPVITRVDDLRDYEESERIAARLAASMCAAITRPMGSSPVTDVDTKTGERKFPFQAGMLFDGLLPGEEVTLIDPKRPAAQAGDWRALQVRSIAAGTGANASTTMRDYNGTYSSQRQELVENTFHVRRRLQAPLVSRLLRPIWQRFSRTAILDGLVPLVGVDPASLTAAAYNMGAIPWIDMLKEVQAEAAAVNAGFKSRAQVIREHDGDPMKVDAELDRDTFEPRQGSAPADQGGAPPADQVDDQEGADAAAA